MNRMDFEPAGESANMTCNMDLSYYNLPMKTKWKCSKALYYFVSLILTIVVSFFASFIVAPWVFNILDLSKIGVSFMYAYSKVSIAITPFILFISCILAYFKYNRMILSERKNVQMSLTDIVCLMKCIFMRFIKTALIFYIFAVISPITIFIPIILIALKSVFKTFM